MKTSSHKPLSENGFKLALGGGAIYGGGTGAVKIYNKNGLGGCIVCQIGYNRYVRGCCQMRTTLYVNRELLEEAMSLAGTQNLRKDGQPEVRRRIKIALLEEKVVIAPPVKAEILSGAMNIKQFNELKIKGVDRNLQTLSMPPFSDD